MDIKKIFQSKVFIRVLIGLAVAAVLLLVFRAGASVGYRKAAFSFRMGDNYYRAFGGDRGGFVPGPHPGELPDAHGGAGRIIKVDLPTFLLEGPDRVEKTVLIQDDTVIRRLRDDVPPTEIKADDYAVVIGAPNDQAQIEAKLIRLLPPPPADEPGFPRR